MIEKAWGFFQYEIHLYTVVSQGHRMIYNNTKYIIKRRFLLRGGEFVLKMSSIDSIVFCLQFF